jgi:hypothetical protein
MYALLDARVLTDNCFDGVYGAECIIGGTIWMWSIGKMLSLGVTRIFGKTQNEPNPASHGTLASSRP